MHANHYACLHERVWKIQGNAGEMEATVLLFCWPSALAQKSGRGDQLALNLLNTSGKSLRKRHCLQVCLNTTISAALSNNGAGRMFIKRYE